MELSTWIIAICSILLVWELHIATRLLKGIRSEMVKLVKDRAVTISTVKHQKRSDPYPRIPRTKAEQHYAGQGTPRPLPGTEPRKSTASGTPVRIGKVAQRRVGGSNGNPKDT